MMSHVKLAVCCTVVRCWTYPKCRFWTDAAKRHSRRSGGGSRLLPLGLWNEKQCSDWTASSSFLDRHCTVLYRTAEYRCCDGRDEVTDYFVTRRRRKSRTKARVLCCSVARDRTVNGLCDRKERGLWCRMNARGGLDELTFGFAESRVVLYRDPLHLPLGGDKVYIMVGCCRRIIWTVLNTMVPTRAFWIENLNVWCSGEAVNGRCFPVKLDSPLLCRVQNVQVRYEFLRNAGTVHMIRWWQAAVAAWLLEISSRVGCAKACAVGKWLDGGLVGRNVVRFSLSQQ